MRDKDYSRFWMFLLGLGSYTKVYVGGIVALSELAAFILAPIILLKHYQEFRQRKFLPALWLALLMIPGCFISCMVNDVYWLWFVKSSMQYYSMFAMIVVFCFVLAKSFKGIGWFLSGSCFQ